MKPSPPNQGGLGEQRAWLVEKQRESSGTVGGIAKSVNCKLHPLDVQVISSANSDNSYNWFQSNLLHIDFNITDKYHYVQ